MRYLQEYKYPDLISGFNTKSRLPHFCNSIPDAISYESKTLFYFHGVKIFTFSMLMQTEWNYLIFPFQCVIHGDLFREGRTCPLMHSKITKLSKNPYQQQYLELHNKFERLQQNILETYPDIITEIQVMWSCDWQALKKTSYKNSFPICPCPPSTD